MMEQRLSGMLDFAVNDLNNNLLPWWMKHLPDACNGGFYGVVRADNSPDTEADRFIVLFARLVWTFSAAYRVTRIKSYAETANRAYDYFTTRFYDQKHGGFFTSVRYDGTPSLKHKLVYGNAFAVYALAEYARAFKSDAAIQRAIETTDLLDKFMYDEVYQGYYETASPDWMHTPSVRGMNRHENELKTMNTHLHMIEAYTNLLRVSESNALRSRVRRLLYIFLNRILNRDTHHFHYFQQRDWIPTTPEQSFGHDIEGSWLLYETAQVLGENEALADTRGVSINMARAVYEDGLHPSGALYSEYDPEKKIFAPHFSWWEQAESVVGFLNAWELSGDEKFFDLSLHTLNYIDSNFIDRERGGWQSHLSHAHKPKTDLHKATGFLCPYHNARMSLEIIERCERRLQEG